MGKRGPRRGFRSLMIAGKIPSFHRGYLDVLGISPTSAIRKAVSDIIDEAIASGKLSEEQIDRYILTLENEREVIARRIETAENLKKDLKIRQELKGTQDQPEVEAPA